jgi:hypothetical protein
MKRVSTVAVVAALFCAARAFSGVFGHGPNSVTIPATGQSLSVVISAPPDGSTIPIPPGSTQVQGSCAVGSVAGQTVNVVYVVDVSGSTDLNFLVSNNRPLVDANGNGVAGDPGDDFNGDGEAGDTLDGEIAGVLALHASIGNPAQVNVGIVAFASDAAAADVDPTPPNTGGISQVYTTPPQADRNSAGGADIEQVLHSLDSDFTTPSGGQIQLFTPVSRAVLGSSTDFVAALGAANTALTHFPAGTNIVFFLSDGESNQGRCFQGACTSQLDAAVAAGTVIYTVGVGASADPVDLQYIANATGGTYTQVTDPSDLSTALPLITPAGLDHAEIDGQPVVLDAVGNFSKTILCADETPFTVTATCFADDPNDTAVSADVMLSCVFLCGNGTVEPGVGEECEPPGTATCDADCQRVPVCGDGFVDAPEQCEPPNSATCDANCVSIVCGNGVLQPGEECEPPSTAVCDASCQRKPVCGDHFVDAPETCDPPDGTTCDTDCTLIVCGNGEVEPGEECEPPSTAVCDASCQRKPLCGDGFIDAPEQCEPPSTANCDANCVLIECGNGIVQSGEECEPPSTGTCDGSCQRVPLCGDGLVDAPESCDPPNGTTCDASCRTIVCGNGIVQPGEECDPPNGTTCGPTCQRIQVCGDGFVDAPETCDPPNGTTCDATCQTIECGNGIVQPGEECDPPQGGVCDGSCQRVPICGDGHVDVPEQCDPPNGTTCDGSCRTIVCGNGIVQPGEECDPPQSGLCDGSCQRVPVCGDGHVDAPEQCDPPNGTTCNPSCKTIVCGDGKVEGVEECDPPDGVTCDAACVAVPCVDPDGDGVCDPVDNCPTDANADQTDTDGDGIGDACDPCTDTDGDGFGDPDFPANTCPPDVCPEVYDPDQADFDGDGQGDVCDEEDDTLNVYLLKLKSSKHVENPNGLIVVRGDFTVPPPLAIEDFFNANEGISVRVKDALFTDETFAWTPDQCDTRMQVVGGVSVLRRINCQAPDRSTKGVFKPFKRNPGAVKFIVKARRRQMPLPFEASVQVTLTSLGVLNRVGSIRDCGTQAAGLKCRE